MKISILCIFTIFIAEPSFAESIFDTPLTYKTSESVLPISYLESLSIKDTAKNLTLLEKEKFACLLINAESVNQKEYKQTYLLRESSQIFKLFLNNFPEFKERPWEGKSNSGQGAIAMSDISDFLLKKNYCVKKSN